MEWQILQEHEIPARAATKRPPSKKATTGSVKRRTVAHRTVEPATAESPRFVKGDMAEEDDFFMQSGDDDLAIGKAQQTQVCIADRDTHSE